MVTEQATHWIPTSEELPVNDRLRMVCWAGGHTFVGYYKEKWYDVNGRELKAPPTHWMRIPNAVSDPLDSAAWRLEQLQGRLRGVLFPPDHELIKAIINHLLEGPCKPTQDEGKMRKNA